MIMMIELMRHLSQSMIVLMKIRVAFSVWWIGEKEKDGMSKDFLLTVSFGRKINKIEHFYFL